MDCGADLRNVIRRCYADFGTKNNIDTDLSAYNDACRNRKRNFYDYYLQGKITFSEDHVKELGWQTYGSETDRTGFIIVLKPRRLLDVELDLQ